MLKSSPMAERPLKVLLVCSHPVQYVAPLFVRLAQHPRLEILVAYASLRGAEKALDPGFGLEIAWDIPVLENYRWISLTPVAPGNPSPHSSAVPVATTAYRNVRSLVASSEWDAIYVSGYYFRQAWTAMLAARLKGIPILLSTDAHSLASWRSNSAIRRKLKELLLRRIYATASVILAGSSGTVAFLKSIGVPSDSILLAGNVVENDWWATRAGQADPVTIRATWKIPPTAPVALFCAKLQPWKRPLDALEAFAAAAVDGSYLVFAGDGPLSPDLLNRARTLGIGSRIRFLGFVNQSRMPEVYAASNILLLPSQYEPFGLVVNEAMLCGCTAIVSDRVGARFDLISDGETGLVFPCGDLPAFTRALRTLLADAALRCRMARAARLRMNSWEPSQNVEAFAQAVQLAATRRASSRKP
jgi:glycosyltransferase involved in cell wall biosynthesis